MCFASDEGSLCATSKMGRSRSSTSYSHVQRLLIGQGSGRSCGRVFGTPHARSLLGRCADSSSVLPNKRLKLTARVDYGMNLSSARRKLKRDSLGGTRDSYGNDRLFQVAF